MDPRAHITSSLITIRRRGGLPPNNFAFVPRRCPLCRQVVSTDSSPPRPALAPERTLLALSPDDRMERAGLDRVQHLRHQPEQPHVRRAIARRPVPVALAQRA